MSVRPKKRPYLPTLRPLQRDSRYPTREGAGTQRWKIDRRRSRNVVELLRTPKSRRKTLKSMFFWIWGSGAGVRVWVRGGSPRSYPGIRGLYVLFLPLGTCCIPRAQGDPLFIILVKSGPLEKRMPFFKKKSVRVTPCSQSL